MKTKHILTFAFCLILAAAFVEAGSLSPDISTFMFKPEVSSYSVGDSSNLHLYLVSTGIVNFTANITLIPAGSTTLGSFNVVSQTGNCIGGICDYSGLWPFTINSLPVTYRVVITDRDTNETFTKEITARTDADGDGYYSVATGGNDCVDTNAAVHPGAAEVCGNGLDDDCTGGDAVCATPPSGGGGGGGSSGGSTGGMLSTGEFNCSGLVNNVIKNDNLRVDYAGKNYSFFVKSIDVNSLGLKLYPIPSRDFAIAQGKTEQIDLDRDKMNDISLKVVELKSGTAKVECTLITQRIPPAKPKQTVTEKVKEVVQEVVEPVVTNIREGVLRIAGESVPKEGPSPVIGSIIVLAIVIAGLVGYFILRKGKDEEEF